jgi:putative methionine-R-sulfoxide reductase with GAF domain
LDLLDDPIGDDDMESNEPLQMTPTESANYASFEQVLSDWRERLINMITRGGVFVGLVTLIPSLIDSILNNEILDIVMSGSAYVIICVIAFVKLPYRFRAGAIVFAVYLLSINSIILSGLRADARVYLTALVPLTLLFFGYRTAISALIMNALLIGVAGWLVVSGQFLLRNPYDQLDALFWVTSGAVVLLIGFMLTISINLLISEFEKARYQGQQLFRALFEERSSLEQRVADRTRALETATEVSRRLSTILNQDQLVREVVEQLQLAFNYYHVHIYLFDENKTILILAGGTGEPGKLMLINGHKIEKGRGLVGRAAETNQVVLIPDVSQAEGWLPNPLLPDTKAEVAVPISIGPDVLGVLDVQHNIVNGLTEQDADLIQAIASQVGIAVQNAQAYQRAQRQAEREARIVAINQHIQAATSIDDVLKVAVSELGEALGARKSNIDLKVNVSSQDGRN